MLVAAKRARQINSYYHNLGEGTFDEYPPPMVETGSKNYLKIALDEIAAGQDQVPLPVARGGSRVARILLGVSGGIAAYKAVELVRLATGAGPRRARGPDAREPELRRAARPSRASPAPGAGRRVRARPGPRRLPGRARADHDPISHLELVRRCDVLCVAPASANTIAKLAARTGRQPADQRRAGLHGAAGGRAGDERPHVRAPGDRGEPGDAARARRARSSRPAAAGSLRRASGGWAGWPSRPSILAAIEAALVGEARFAPRSLDGLRVLVTAGGTREPIDSVRYVGNRSSGRMGLALAERPPAAAPR